MDFSNHHQETCCRVLHTWPLPPWGCYHKRDYPSDCFQAASEPNGVQFSLNFQAGFNSGPYEFWCIVKCDCPATVHLVKAHAINIDFSFRNPNFLYPSRQQSIKFSPKRDRLTWCTVPQKVPNGMKEDSLLVIKVEIQYKSTLEADVELHQLEAQSNERFGQSIGGLSNSGLHSDFIVRVQGQDFQVHRCILAARSDYFRAMLDHNTSEASKGVAELSEDISAAEWQLLQDFIYTGKLTTANSENAVGDWTRFGALADQFLLYDLLQLISKKLENILNIDSVEMCLRFAYSHPLSNLENKCYLAIRNLKHVSRHELMNSERWQDFVTEFPEFWKNYSLFDKQDSQ